MFVSDIHGNLDIFERCIEIFNNEQADKIVFLGDTGAGYYNEDNNQRIAQTLNDMKNRVKLIRGNCDRSDFEALLEFNLYDDDTLYINGKFVTVTHGHLNGNYYLPQYCGEIYIQGHTHVPVLQKQGSYVIANPGSPTRPRGVNLKCYIIIDETSIKLKSFDGDVIKEIYFNEE
jgi:putative phosphoesterase